MARIIVERNPYRIKLPGQVGNIIKIMETELEPPKDYLWSTPLGDLYVYYCSDWVHIEDFLANPYFDCANPTPEQDEIDERLRSFEDRVMERVAQYVIEHAGTNIDVENRLAALESIDHSQFITAEDV